MTAALTQLSLTGELCKDRVSAGMLGWWQLAVPASVAQQVRQGILGYSCLQIHQDFQLDLSLSAGTLQPQENLIAMKGRFAWRLLAPVGNCLL